MSYYSVSSKKCFNGSDPFQKSVPRAHLYQSGNDKIFNNSRKLETPVLNIQPYKELSIFFKNMTLPESYTGIIRGSNLILFA